MGQLNPEQQESWKKRHGQIYDPKNGTTLPTIEFEAPYTDDGTGTNNVVTAYDGMAGYEITPIDGNQARIRITDAAAVGEFLENQWVITPAYTVVSGLPDVLNGVDVAFNKSIGDGQSNYPVSQQAFAVFSRGSGSLSPKATAEGSASIVPSVTPDISDHFRRKQVKSTNYTFFMPAETTIEDILAKLSAKIGSTVLEFPDFNPKPHRVRCFGQQVSVQASATSEASLSFTSDEDDGITSETISWQYGDGYSKSNGVSEKVEQIQACIHAAITIADNTDSADVSAQVQANTTDIDINAVTQIEEITNEPDPVESTASASAFFENGTATVGATAGAASIPDTGLIMTNIAAERDSQYDFVRVTAEVVDFVQYAA